MSGPTCTNKRYCRANYPNFTLAQKAQSIFERVLPTKSKQQKILQQLLVIIRLVYSLAM